MLGNLSKILIKTPNFFNNSPKEFEKTNQSKIIINYNSNKDIKARKYRLNGIYFREKDFWLKNYEPEINFNHNKRSPLSMKYSNLKKISDKIMLKYNSGIKTSSNYKDKIIKYYITDRYNKNNKFSFPNNNNICTISSSNTKNHFMKDLLLKTESIKISKRKNFNLNVNDTDNSNFISININDSKIDEKNNNNNTKNKKNKFTIDFPSIYRSLKSQENLFIDGLDRKFNSLKLIRPEIKEQLKTKNRSMVGRKEFLRFQRLKLSNSKNPFYESIKMKEESNNNSFKFI